ncbi:hypothetical protein BRADI_1g20851v3 [Brachypodium distachyon]|uniref:Uncharacterized protein n=1 Tax=Brachypodium distachyon TaxID=15368 RepID=A0A2K2DKB9_BRADI|nr:hypothetical protein BRADI_1g20851v3 [Brachypodium distachyon]
MVLFFSGMCMHACTPPSAEVGCQVNACVLMLFKSPKDDSRQLTLPTVPVTLHDSATTTRLFIHSSAKEHAMHAILAN